MNLYIIRHAIAVDLGNQGVTQDSQRPLTELGRRKMVSISRGLLAFGVELDMILSSPYLRAAETAGILAEAFKMKETLAISGQLSPLGDPGQLIAEINEKYSAANLALVGHEPSLSGLAGMLLAGSPNVAINLKKGGVCSLSFSGRIQQRSATLEWLLTPAQLVMLAQ